MFDLTPPEKLLIAISLIFCAIFIATLVRLTLKFSCVKFMSDVNLTSKTVLITGANSGIGRETALFMAKKGARVIMACRNLERSKIARDEIAAESENEKVILYQLDLASFQSIRSFCANIIEHETKVDVLIHNAGYCGVMQKSVSVDGIESTMATNCYGPFLVTRLLMDLLKKSAPCRVVVVSSKIHPLAIFNPSNEKHLNPVDCWLPFWQYANSKLASLLLNFEFAKRLQGTGVTINALHPGVVDTNMWSNRQFPLNLMMRIPRLFYRTLNEGIQTILHVALSPDANTITGQYFRNCQFGTTSNRARNEDLQKKMFEAAERIVGLTVNDPVV